LTASKSSGLPEYHPFGAEELPLELAEVELLDEEEDAREDVWLRAADAEGFGALP
jgi:hypothetical protein